MLLGICLVSHTRFAEVHLVVDYARQYPLVLGVDYATYLLASILTLTNLYDFA